MEGCVEPSLTPTTQYPSSGPGAPLRPAPSYGATIGSVRVSGQLQWLSLRRHRPRGRRGRHVAESSQRCPKLERLQHLALSHDWQTSPQNRKRRSPRIFLLCLGCKNAEKKNSSWDTTEGEVLDFDHAAQNTRTVFHWERCASLCWAWVLFRSPKKQSSLEEGLHLWAWAQIIHVGILCGCTNTAVGMSGSFKRLSPEKMAKSWSLWWETAQANELEKGFSKRSREENMESSTSGSESFDIQMFSCVMRTGCPSGCLCTSWKTSGGAADGCWRCHRTDKNHPKEPGNSWWGRWSNTSRC